MPLFDNLERAAFAGLPFPVSDVEVTGGLRDHVHEYPHSPGGAPEKLGRKLYEFSFTAPMLAGFPRYPKLWPETAAGLRMVFEAGQTDDLVIPIIGTIKAYCTSWREKAVGTIRNGTVMSMTFREDASDLFLTEALVTQSSASLAGAGALLLTQMQEEGLSGIAALDAIAAASAAVSAVSSTIELYSNLIESKCAGLSRLCDDADKSVTELSDPVHFRVGEAMRGVWTSSERLRKDVLRHSIPLVPFITPTIMSVADVSRAIYGSNAKASELLRLNAFGDPFRIPAGTSVKAYAVYVNGVT